MSRRFLYLSVPAVSEWGPVRADADDMRTAAMHLYVDHIFRGTTSLDHIGESRVPCDTRCTCRLLSTLRYNFYK